MEYADNGTLLDLVKQKHSLSEKDAHLYFSQLIAGIQYCHSRHIAHRDLKLENLLMTTDNCLKICDFGFARYFEYDANDRKLSATFCGSNAYASPELLKELPYNPMLADVFACGVILYAMVFGSLPFDDSHSISQLIRVVFYFSFMSYSVKKSTKY